VNSSKYIGMDVHTATISVAVLDAAGKLIMDSVVEAKASTILQFIHGLRGELYVTLEEGTWAAWLYDLLRPHVTNIVVCDPRRNALLKEGSKSDRIDARKLAELLRTNLLRPVYHGEKGLRTLKELARAYLTISKDLIRVMNRVKAIYRSWGIPCAGQSVYHPRNREEWLRRITQASVRRRAELYYEQLDAKAICWAIRGQPQLGFRCFISTTTWISSALGPLGPGFRRRFDENSIRYFCLLMALSSCELEAVGVTVHRKKYSFDRTSSSMTSTLRAMAGR